MKNLFFVCFCAFFCFLSASHHVSAAPATLTFENTPGLTLYHGDSWTGEVTPWTQNDYDTANTNPEFSTDVAKHMAANKTPHTFPSQPEHHYYWGSVSLAPVGGIPNQMVSGGLYDTKATALAEMTFTLGDTTVCVLGSSFEGSTGGFGLSASYDKSEAGPINQISLWAPTDASGNPGGTFLVAYDNFFAHTWMYPDTDVEKFTAPTILFDKASDVLSVDLANTTYTTLSMFTGDSFGKKFKYEDNDYLGVTITGLDEFGDAMLDRTMDFYLADFRTANGGGILEDWATVDLAFNDVHGLRFEMFTSDGDPMWGPNTPFYFAMDNLVLDLTGTDGGSGVPEPATWLMLLAGCGWMAWRKRG